MKRRLTIDKPDRSCRQHLTFINSRSCLAFLQEERSVEAGSQ